MLKQSKKNIKFYYSSLKDKYSKTFTPETEIVWRNVWLFIYIHLAALYGLYLTLTVQSKISTYMLTYFYGYVGGLGVTVGSHRLWSHKAFKAKFPLKVILVVLHTICVQNPILIWCRDHRAHHKFTNTNGDPHNYQRGFFFAHMGWLLVRKHPDLIKNGQTIDLSDLEQEKILVFQKKYYGWLVLVFAVLIPMFSIPYITNDTLANGWHVCVMLRYLISLHNSWLINSRAHKFGLRPYDANITATESSFLGWVVHGEGWHNFHHVFPWDYRAAENGMYRYNSSKLFVDFFAKIGWAYDLKVASEESIRKRAKRTGPLTEEDAATAAELVSQRDYVENSKKFENFEISKPRVWGK